MPSQILHYSTNTFAIVLLCCTVCSGNFIFEITTRPLSQAINPEAHFNWALISQNCQALYHIFLCAWLHLMLTYLCASPR